MNWINSWREGNKKNIIDFAEGNYGAMLIESLTIAPCAPPEPPAIGCMDENACNYNSDANIFDNSCYNYYLLSKGNLIYANKLLKRNWSIESLVQRGRQTDGKKNWISNM